MRDWPLTGGFILEVYELKGVVLIPGFVTVLAQLLSYSIIELIVLWLRAAALAFSGLNGVLGGIPAVAA